jgi:hypothetical protein
MEAEGGGERAGPSAAVAELTAAAEPKPESEPESEPERIEPEPAAAHAPWVRPIGDYDRRETTTVEGLRYG